MTLPVLYINLTKCWSQLQSNTPSTKRHRKYIRHPSDVPIRVTLNWVEDEKDTHPCDRLNNVGLGGLSFKSSQGLPTGQSVSVSFPAIHQNLNLVGTVMWNKKIDDGFEIGLQFDSSDELFRIRMIEQICQIEHYQKEILQQEGRDLTIEEAAREWIDRYAGDFPSLSQ